MGGALAEARAAWQRTAANRCCLVQEDAKRAPKLACCSSMPPTAAAKPTTQDVPSTTNRIPSNYSPNSKWWLHPQPNCGYQKGLIDDQFNSPQAYNMELDSCLSAQTTNNPGRKYINDHYKEEELGDQIRDHVGCQVSKTLYFDSNSSEKNAPWWRTADTKELAYLVAQRSHELIENCDLPMPQNARAKKDPNVNICHFGHHEITKTPVRGSGNHVCSSTDHAYTPDSLILESACISVKGQLMSGPDKQWRDSQAHERIPVINTFENDASKAKLLEALRHSQTRAREAEKAAKQAYSEKEHVVKLVFRQASQLFAYKQWLRLLQLENMYFQFRKSVSVKRCSYNCTLDTSKK